MTKISGSYFGHWHFVVWLGAAVIFIVAASFSEVEKRDLLIVVTCTALAISLAIKLYDWLWDVADEIYDGGDFLTLKRRGEEESVPLSEIASVVWIDRYWLTRQPGRITLRLAHPGKFGPEIAFFPKRSIDETLFGTSAVAENLAARINRAQSRSAP